MGRALAAYEVPSVSKTGEDAVIAAGTSDGDEPGVLREARMLRAWLDSLPDR